MKIKSKLANKFMVAGLIVSIICCFVQCNTKNKPQSGDEAKKQVESEKLMPQWANEINKSCPMNVDPITRLDSVKVFPDRLFQYYYTITKRSDFDVEQWKTFGEKQIINMYRTDANMEDFRTHGISVKYQYADTTGNAFYSFTITPEDYQ